MPTASGKYLYLAKSYVKSKFGDDGLQKAISRLDKEDQDAYKGIIISTKPYPLSTYQHFLKAIAEEFGEKELELFSEDIAKKMLFGFFGILAKFISIDTALSKITELWRHAFGEGKIEVKERTEHSIILVLSDFVYHDDIPIKSKEMNLYLMSAEVFIRQALIMIAGKPVRSSHKAISRTVNEFYFYY